MLLFTRPEVDEGGGHDGRVGEGSGRAGRSGRRGRVLERSKVTDASNEVEGIGNKFLLRR